MAWKTYFRVKPNSPMSCSHNGVKLNFRSTLLPLERVLKAYRDGCQYLELTEKGSAKFPDLLSLKPLPDVLPKSIIERKIADLNQEPPAGDDSGSGTGELETSDDDSGSGTGEKESSGDDSGSGTGEEELPVPVAPSPEEVVLLAIEKGLLVKSGNTRYEFEGQKYGTKAILSNTAVIATLIAKLA